MMQKTKKPNTLPLKPYEAVVEKELQYVPYEQRGTVELPAQLRPAEQMREEAKAYIKDLQEAGYVQDTREILKNLDRFGDRLPHILQGDQGGGGHFYPCVRDNGGGISRTHKPDLSGEYIDYVSDEEIAILKEDQGITEGDPVYCPEVVISYEQDGKQRYALKQVTFFPEAWDAEDIAHAVLKVADYTPIDFSERQGAKMYEHEGTVDGVKLHVVTTSPKGGRIVTAYPVPKSAKTLKLEG